MSPSLLRRSRPAIGGAGGLLVALLLAVPLLGAVAPARQQQGPAAREGMSSAARQSNPDLACAQCHAAIVASYEQTPMAGGSGPALDGLVTGSYTHAPSGIRYTVSREGDQAVLRYTRKSGGLDGSMRLAYFIGSGKHGRTYLYRQDGFWYESPINRYTRRAAWGMLPGFDAARNMPLNPTDANCLHCHATGLAQALPQAANHFAGVPFAQGGVGCAACHGDPAAHLASAGRVATVNPAKLTSSKRDSVCLQCHLEGDALAYLPGRSLATFKPGEDLAETAVYFVRASRAGGGGRAASQYEALLRSACRRAVGDRFSCTTCHNPHATPATRGEAVAWFRGRCLSCHTGPAMAAHHPEQPDCAGCHMPSRATTDVSHEQVTDHDIEVYGKAGKPALPLGDDTLVAVGGIKAGAREQGLAYAQLAMAGDANAAPRATALLVEAESEGANDPALHARLGYLEQRAGDAKRARAEYVAALNGDLWEPSALANLAVLDAVEGRVGDAVRLLERLLTANPGQTGPGLNLALLLCSSGHGAEASAVLGRLAVFNPDDPALRRFRASGNYAGRHCSLPPAAPELGNAR